VNSGGAPSEGESREHGVRGRAGEMLVLSDAAEAESSLAGGELDMR